MPALSDGLKGDAISVVHYFIDDGDVPNHPRWPVIVYPQTIGHQTFAAETAFDDLFKANNWIVRFRAGIYPFVHYHSNAHEALGIARGEATVCFGGDAGKALSVKAGDGVLLPAGTGHQLIASSEDLLVIGAYPPGPDRDLMRAGELDKRGIRERVSAVPKPLNDPFAGPDGPMVHFWKVP